MIIKRGLHQVKDWNREKRAQHQYTLMYTLGSGAMHEEPRQRGWVVQKWHKEGGERSSFHLSPKEAREDYQSDKF